MSVEGMGRTAIARVEGAGWNTANRWLAKASCKNPCEDVSAIRSLERGRASKWTDLTRVKSRASLQ